MIAHQNKQSVAQFNKVLEKGNKCPDSMKEPEMACDTNVKNNCMMLPMAAKEVEPSEDLDGFEVVRHRKVRKYIIGQNSDCSLRVAPREIDIHVWRLSLETSTEYITRYIHRTIPDIPLKYETLKARGNYSSFKITTVESAQESLMQPEFWPNGVAVDRFFNRRPGPPKLT